MNKVAVREFVGCSKWLKGSGAWIVVLVYCTVTEAVSDTAASDV
jgi:hypothetical protein